MCRIVLRVLYVHCFTFISHSGVECARDSDVLFDLPVLPDLLLFREISVPIHILTFHPARSPPCFRVWIRYVLPCLVFAYALKSYPKNILCSAIIYTIGLDGTLHPELLCCILWFAWLYEA